MGTKISYKPNSAVKPFREGLNLPAFMRMKRGLKEETRRFEMDSWINDINPNTKNDRSFSPGYYRLLEFPPCNTAFCMGGTLALVDGKIDQFRKESRRWGTEHIDMNYVCDKIRLYANEALKITDEESNELFRLPEWPYDLKYMYAEAKTPWQRVRAGCLTLDRFVRYGPFADEWNSPGLIFITGNIRFPPGQILGSSNITVSDDNL
jgi:hypothetical protein